MSTLNRKAKLIKRFKNLLRSGEDLTVEYMCQKAATGLYYTTGTAMKIINEHYNSDVITDRMREFVANFEKCGRKKQIKMFSEEFLFCPRESVLIMRYIRRNGNHIN